MKQTKFRNLPFHKSKFEPNQALQLETEIFLRNLDDFQAGGVRKMCTAGEGVDLSIFYLVGENEVTFGETAGLSVRIRTRLQTGLNYARHLFLSQLSISNRCKNHFHSREALTFLPLLTLIIRNTTIHHHSRTSLKSTGRSISARAKSTS